MTPHALTEQRRIDGPVEAHLRASGEIFRTFAAQDSGNLAYGVRCAGERFFVKTPGRADASGHGRRVAALRRAASLYASFEHPAVPRLVNTLETLEGTCLVSEWRDGELLHASRSERSKPGSALGRFRALPTDRIEAAIGVGIDVFRALAASGRVVVDFYDGSLLYDFDSHRTTVIDLDETRDGAFDNPMGRMYGSTRFMAPEEFELGARIDERTNVFVLGRAALVLLGDGSEGRSAFRGGDETHRVALRACRPDPAERYPTVAELARAWGASLPGR